MNAIQAIRGMNDILPEDTDMWLHVESTCRSVLEAYRYRQIRTPLLESTELFARSIGEETDIVSKEMYTFLDRNGDSLTLRPEGTAGCARAGIQNGLFHNQQQRLWYLGPMFRHERPQKGRFRQFHQFGAEAYGWPGPDIDAELIAITARVWRELGLTRPRLEINSLGTRETRRRYQAELVGYLESCIDKLDDDSVRRLKTNPLRILDSKNPGVQDVLVDAPSILSFLDPECDDELALLKGNLDSMGIEYRINQRLVRGLDYYSKIVFEWVVDGIGAQSAICAGGRYDDLVAEIGGRPTPAVGFAAGLERIVDLIIEEGGGVAATNPDIFIVSEGNEARGRALVLGEELRDASLRVQVHFGEGGIKNQFKKADKSGAKLAVVIAGQELSEGKVTVKKLRNGGEQRMVDDGETLKTVQELLNSL
jgi:histidyl-tRNA synthetase